MALDLARSSTAYVTLEPCAHHGKTPPCAHALLQAGVSKVVIAVPDPNPLASGGIKLLEEAGVGVELGMLADLATEANFRWLRAMRLGRPYVTAKAAISLDGQIALASGESRWITNEASRRAGQRLRAEHSAILVGRRTIALDNPKLTVRAHRLNNQPTRVVLDPNARLTGREAVFHGRGPSMWVIGPEVAAAKSRAEIVRLPMPSSSFEPRTVLASLWERGLTSVLVEGGGETITRFVEAGLVDEIQLFMAPILIGTGTPWIRIPPLKDLQNASRFRLVGIKRRDDDLNLVYRVPLV
jgi:diaminohydroxyphosphoribosylaminopyrimidine deaminase/5-amino-6-(5-phosphoribosylamino)uracil reductase